jgi:tetratricopeptide (TPR) repeat protein
MAKRWIGSLVIALLLVAPQLAWPEVGAAFYNLTVNEDVIANVTLPTIEGGEAPLLDPAKGASVFIFFRPGAEPSRRGLSDMARCAEELAAYPVHWVGLVSDRYPLEEVKALVAQANFPGPVLIDQGNALYGKFGVRLHPVVGITDRQGRLTAYQPFTQINFCARVKAQVLHTLGEISAEELEQQLRPRSLDPRSDIGVATRNLRMGERFIELGNYEMALATAQRSLELVPDLAGGHGLAALALAHQDECAAAAEHIKKALEQDPAEAKALAAREKCGP